MWSVFLVKKNLTSQGSGRPNMGFVYHCIRFLPVFWMPWPVADIWHQFGAGRVWWFVRLLEIQRMLRHNFGSQWAATTPTAKDATPTKWVLVGDSGWACEQWAACGPEWLIHIYSDDIDINSGISGRTASCVPMFVIGPFEVSKELNCFRCNIAATQERRDAGLWTEPPGCRLTVCPHVLDGVGSRNHIIY